MFVLGEMAVRRRRCKLVSPHPSSGLARASVCVDNVLNMFTECHQRRCYRRQVMGDTADFYLTPAATVEEGTAKYLELTGGFVYEVKTTRSKCQDQTQWKSIDTFNPFCRVFMRLLRQRLGPISRTAGLEYLPAPSLVLA